MRARRAAACLTACALVLALAHRAAGEGGVPAPEECGYLPAVPSPEVDGFTVAELRRRARSEERYVDLGSFPTLRRPRAE